MEIQRISYVLVPTNFGYLNFPTKGAAEKFINNQTTATLEAMGLSDNQAESANRPKSESTAKNQEAKTGK